MKMNDKKKNSLKHDKAKTPKIIDQCRNEYGINYSYYIDPDTELIPTVSDIGKVLQVAGWSKREYCKLISIDEKKQVVDVLDYRGSFRTLEIARVILHTDKKMRNKDVSLVGMIADAKHRRREKRK